VGAVEGWAWQARALVDGTERLSVSAGMTDSRLNSGAGASFGVVDTPSTTRAQLWDVHSGTSGSSNMPAQHDATNPFLNLAPFQSVPFQSATGSEKVTQNPLLASRAENLVALHAAQQATNTPPSARSVRVSETELARRESAVLEREQAVARREAAVRQQEPNIQNWPFGGYLGFTLARHDIRADVPGPSQLLAYCHYYGWCLYMLATILNLVASIAFSIVFNHFQGQAVLVDTMNVILAAVSFYLWHKQLYTQLYKNNSVSWISCRFYAFFSLLRVVWAGWNVVGECDTQAVGGITAVMVYGGSGWLSYKCLTDFSAKGGGFAGVSADETRDLARLYMVSSSAWTVTLSVLVPLQIWAYKVLKKLPIPGFERQPAGASRHMEVGMRAIY
jgi:SCAMP family